MRYTSDTVTITLEGVPLDLGPGGFVDIREHLRETASPSVSAGYVNRPVDGPKNRAQARAAAALARRAR